MKKAWSDLRFKLIKSCVSFLCHWTEMITVFEHIALTLSLSSIGWTNRKYCPKLTLGLGERAEVVLGLKLAHSFCGTDQITKIMIVCHWLVKKDVLRNN